MASQADHCRWLLDPACAGMTKGLSMSPNITPITLGVADVAKAREYWHSILLAEGREKAGALGSVPVGSSVQAGSINQVWLTNGLVRDAIAGGSDAD